MKSRVSKKVNRKFVLVGGAVRANPTYIESATALSDYE